MSEIAQNDKEFSKEWDYLKLILQKYDNLLMALNTFALSLQGMEHKIASRNMLIASLNTFHFAVTGQFRRYFETKHFKEIDFPNTTVTIKHYHISQMVMIKEDLILMEMVEIISFWAQTKGPFATLNEVIDPRNAYAKG